MTGGLQRQAGRLTCILAAGSVEMSMSVRVSEENYSQKYRPAARRCLLIIIPSGLLLHEPLVGTTTTMEQPGVKVARVIHRTSCYKIAQ